MNKIGYAEKKILDYLYEHEDARAIDLYKLTSNKLKPIKRLEDKQLIFRKKDGRYVAGKTMFDVIFQEFMFNIALNYFFKYLEDLKKRGKPDIDILLSPEMVKRYGQLIPYFTEFIKNRDTSDIKAKLE